MFTFPLTDKALTFFLAFKFSLGSLSDTSNSGFRPITTSYSSVNNYAGNPQPSAASNVNVSHSLIDKLISTQDFERFWGKRPKIDSTCFKRL